MCTDVFKFPFQIHYNLKWFHLFIYIKGEKQGKLEKKTEMNRKRERKKKKQIVRNFPLFI